ncbi:MAG: UDP-glucose/GDP-mannose dehydrogenase family protein, partial [Candidatus Heimdallarchaeota archaeon]|nr:UDP-glucose/GDP-mannose dehydrogenase family protein [Candidatus Heimdallarchaeota archaeon]
AQAFEEGQEYKVVVVKSTCNPGTTTDIVKPILETSKLTSGKDFGVGMNPEFLREGVALKDFLAPDRIVIGGNDERSRQLIAKTYEGFEAPILQVDPTTAEIIKLASNSFLAMKISFINEIANIAEKIGSDVSSIAQGVGMDERISNKFLRAGLGYGGSCFPKDVAALSQKSKELNVPSKLLEATIEANKIQPLRAINLLKETFEGESLKDKRIAILGLAFKPDTDDVRDAVSVPIIEKLLEEGAIVYATDPVAMKNFER